MAERRRGATAWLKVHRKSASETSLSVNSDQPHRIVENRGLKEFTSACSDSKDVGAGRRHIASSFRFVGTATKKKKKKKKKKNARGGAVALGKGIHVCK